MAEVKKRRRGVTTLSTKNQATIPIDALRGAGLEPGDRLRVEAAGAGRVVLVRMDDVIERHAGALTGIYPAGHLDELRKEWR
jgi:bifunctional DNA-binding transcriptional regulator/antitoxin component of YhaV-PrlF toxin-antitoxin module